MTHALGELEEAVERLIASGRYASKDEILREGVRLLEERERKLEGLDAAIERGLADTEAGRVSPASDVFDRLERKYRTTSVV
ncbi:type II toxin-antitoxin system ParD family antitoxin [Methylocystis sp. WRRC1]|uniref:type II toxin-antitoxin system ParD family antitoxin n=1 Tax=Methylocystis sp. WRRC1 TaxID=1732014 RepID=UPI001D15A293|nr:type II toxin-antitoxin system ParD family antitoxin [Methylocystis sp. WRRC1]MCC3247035.1 type II toxin-antitoxin system ParD family antitoxin [Methylocystis sp. WRRC1]